MSFDTDTRSPASRLADRRWRIRHSAWTLAPILGLGWFSFVGFLYVALRARTRKFWIACIIACAASAFAMLAMSLGNRPSGGDWGVGITLVVWIGLIIYAFIINRAYLRWRAGSTNADAWYNQPSSDPQAKAPAYPGSPTPPAPAGFPSVDTTEYYAPTSTAAVPEPRTATSPSSTDMPDINSATAEGLVSALTIDRALADRVIGARSASGGFRNLDELVTLAGLQPHELIKFRGKVTFDSFTPSSPAPPGGRFLDY